MSDVVESQRWSNEEVARLVEIGPAAFMQATKRSWHSVRSKYNKLGFRLSETEAPEHRHCVVRD